MFSLILFMFIGLQLSMPTAYWVFYAFSCVVWIIKSTITVCNLANKLKEE